MGLFSRLRGNRADANADPAKPASHAPLQGRSHAAAYDAGLIDRLKDGHRELLRTFGAVQAAAAESRFGDIEHLLSHFRQTLHAHIAAENARFYPSLQQGVTHSAEAAALIADARREMNDLAFDVLKVVDAYIAYPPTHLNEAQLKYDLEQTAALLAKRVQKAEAQLYPLYRR